MATDMWAYLQGLLQGPVHWGEALVEAVQAQQQERAAQQRQALGDACQRAALQLGARARGEGAQLRARELRAEAEGHWRAAALHRARGRAHCRAARCVERRATRMHVMAIWASLWLQDAGVPRGLVDAADRELS
eukprot:m51a1_g14356 hypothetical protein (134) ;mRNA; r:198528-198929